MSFLIKGRSRSRRRAASSKFLRTAAAGDCHYAEALERRRLLTAISWTGSFDHMNWNQPGNWSSNTVPTASDDVTINTADTIQSNSKQAVHNLTLTSGTITGTGELDVGGAFHWTNGTMEGAGKTVVAATGSMALDSGNHDLNRELDLNGPTTWTAGGIRLVDSGTINNNAAFTATAPTNMTISVFRIGLNNVNAFNNQAAGVFVTNGPGVVHCQLPFNNAGSVRVQLGTLQIASGGMSTGGFAVSTGAALAFTTLDYTFAAGNSASGGGSFQFTSGTQTLAADQTFPDLTLGNSTLNNTETVMGPGSLTVTGLFHWMNGVLAATKTIIPATGSLTIDTNISHQLDGELDLNGPTTWTGGNFALAGGTINNNATFTAFGQMVSDAGANAFNNQAAGSFVTNGAVHIFSNAPGTGVLFNNAGSVRVQSGTLQIGSGGRSTGGFAVSTGATLALTGGVYVFAAGNSVSGGGSVQFTGGEQTMATDQTFPNLTFNSSMNFPVNNDEVTGPGSLTVTGSFHWINGTLAGGSKTIVSSTGSLTVDTLGNRQLSGELDLNGPSTWTAGNIDLNGGTINNNAAFTATAPANMTLFMRGMGFGTVSAFNNQAAGSFVANGPGTVHVFSFSGVHLSFNNAGDVKIQSGTLRLESDGSHTGNFDGQAGATLLFLDNQTFAASSHINGNLNLEIDSGTDTYPNGLNTTGTVTFHGGSFTVGGNASAGTIMVTGGTGVLNGAANNTNSLSITSGKLELGGALTIHYGGAPFLTPTIRGYLQTGVLAPAVAGGSLGYADGADGIVANLSAGQFLIKPAIPGDANLDGKVGFPDLVLLARHYGATNAGWDVGDFNYDARVGFDDLIALARDYGKTGPAAAALAGRASVLAATTPLTLQPSLRKHRIII